MKKLKVALVHDYIKEYGGAERVLETLHEIWPDAPIYTSVYLPNYLGPHKERIIKWDIRPSFLQKLPFKAKLISPLRLIAPFVFSKMDFSQYDVVIVSATGAYTPNMIQKGKAKQVCYCHTPPRYLYGYATARKLSNNILINILSHIANHFLRMLDFESSEKPDYFIANSNEVAQRIEKFYRRKSIVIYPPIKIIKENDNLKPLKKRNYFVTGGRLARAKRIDLAIKAFNILGYPLKVFGRDFANYGSELKNKAEGNIEFLGEVNDEEKLELLKGAKAFIFPSPDEDFGITPVEAMSQGTPVIAYKGGGVMETVIDGKTGVFFEKLSGNSIIRAIKKLERSKIEPIDCKKRAQEFSSERFKKEIINFIKTI